MSKPVTTAVIMAAGMGTRLKELGTQAPKGFLKLGERPIIEESIERLQQSGISSIIIVTGHLDHFYVELKDRYPGLLTFVHNDKFSDSGSMYSLYLARDLVNSDFLLLESDLIYEQRALTHLINSSYSDAILLSGTTHSGDEVYVTHDEDRIVDMSKNKAELSGPIAGELVGISKISNNLYQTMNTYAEQRFKETLHVDYETDCLVGVANDYPVHYILVEDLLWSEIDDENHLQRAREKIYPSILKTEENSYRT